MALKRVVITGLGIVSPIGNSLLEVIDSLKLGKSGIAFDEAFKEHGLKSNVSGQVKNLDLQARIDKKHLRFMRNAAAYSYIAMQDAITDAGLKDEDVSNTKTGIIAGSGGASNSSIIEVHEIATNKSIRRIGPYRVTQTMGSTVSACLATPFKIKGVNYSISSACSTSAHCVGNAMELIQMGKQDIIFAGGGEELNWNMAAMFDAMGALSSNFNTTPAKASRAYDANRDGFVIASGGAMLVVEELEHALARDAKIYAELVGYGANSDGYDMVAPSGEGAARCMQMALDNLDLEVDYINTHGTSTPAGDIRELEAIKLVFADKIPAIGSTKSLAGHSLGATGAHELIYSLLMLDNDFIAPSINIESLDLEAQAMPIVQQYKPNIGLTTVMSNSFGFGGTNSCIVATKYNQ